MGSIQASFLLKEIPSTQNNPNGLQLKHVIRLVLKSYGAVLLLNQITCTL